MDKRFLLYAIVCAVCIYGLGIIIGQRFNSETYIIETDKILDKVKEK